MFGQPTLSQKTADAKQLHESAVARLAQLQESFDNADSGKLEPLARDLASAKLVVTETQKRLATAEQAERQSTLAPLLAERTRLEESLNIKSFEADVAALVEKEVAIRCELAALQPAFDAMVEKDAQTCRRIRELDVQIGDRPPSQPWAGSGVGRVAGNQVAKLVDQELRRRFGTQLLDRIRPIDR